MLPVAISSSSGGFSLTSNADQVVKDLQLVWADQVPYAISLTLNALADRAKAELVEEMGRVFDRPTAFTLNSLRVVYSKKSNLVATVKTKDEALKSKGPAEWLKPEAEGGPRKVKRYESLLRLAGVLGLDEFTQVGEAARLDQYGNIAKSQLTTILSDMRAYRMEGSNKNATRESTGKRYRRTKKRGGIYVYIRAGGRLRRGIYERTQFGFGSSLRPVLIFTKGAPQYKRRFAMKETTERVVSQYGAQYFAEAMDKAIRTARAKERA
jgi:hypothetical protein